MGQVARQIEPRVRQALDAFRAVVLHGPRQSGKTALVRQIAAERGGSYASLDNERTRLDALRDPDAFLLAQPHPLVIEEIQLGGDRLVRALKLAVDDSEAKGRLLLTCAGDFLSVPTISESLAGRAAILRIWPLSAAETAGAAVGLPGAASEMTGSAGGGILDWFEKPVPVGGDSPLSRADYLEMACAGGYPEALGLSGQSRRLWFDSYAETVVRRDLAAPAGVRRPAAVRAVLQLAATRTARELNAADWCRRLGTSHATLEAHLGLLRTAFLVHEVPAWSPDLTARAVRRPKLYVADSGLAAALVGADAEALRSPTVLSAAGPLQRPAGAAARSLRRPAGLSAGAILETFAVNEITRQIAAVGAPLTLHHYRDSAFHEIGLVIERSDGAVVAAEIESAASPDPDRLRHIAWLRNRLDEVSPGAFRVGVLLHTEPHSCRVADRLYSVPLSVLWHPSQ